LPTENRDRLTEPYVTTREKGTGLGLAIVKKIMEDHGGSLLLEDRPEGGARITLRFRAAGIPAAVDAATEPGMAASSPQDELKGDDDSKFRLGATGTLGHGA
jgi:two-component system nitrogen regulation sensor histidine kinase NtrY